MIIEDASFNEVVKFISTLELKNKKEMLKLLTKDIEDTIIDDAVKANTNDPMMNFRRQLNKENQKLFDEMLANVIKIEGGYQLYKKQFNSMKDRIKKAHVKIKEIAEEDEKLGQSYSHIKYMENSEVSYIERRFPMIDKAIDCYKRCRKRYASSLKKLIAARSDNNAYFPIQFKNLESDFSEWFNTKRSTEDGIRISNGHYTKIQEAFDSDRRSKERNKLWKIQAEEREAAAALIKSE